MALKLKDEPITTVQKTGSDYVNRDYSKLADDILHSEEELPESRYSSSNSYQTMNNDLNGLNAQFKMDDYNRHDNMFGKISKYSDRRVLPKFNWFTNDDGDNSLAIYFGIIICAIIMVMYFHRGMTSLRDISRDTVELEATITSVEHRERYEKRGRRSGRWVDEYKTTYEWVGENGEIQSNTRYYDEQKFSKGDIATVTVLANNLNQEIDSKTTAKGKCVSSFLFSAAGLALLIVCIIRLKKSQE